MRAPTVDRMIHYGAWGVVFGDLLALVLHRLHLKGVI